MKSLGIVRSIDELGRVVIPKEIRKTMRLRDGDPLDIFAGAEGVIILKRYSPVGGIVAIAQSYAEALSQKTDLPILITDQDHVLFSTGLSAEEDANGHKTSRSLEKTIENGVDFIAQPDGKHLHPVDGLKREAAVACPITGRGNPAGCVVMLMNKAGDMPTQTEVALAQVAACFLGRQLGI